MNVAVNRGFETHDLQHCAMFLYGAFLILYLYAQVASGFSNVPV